MSRMVCKNCKETVNSVNEAYVSFTGGSVGADVDYAFDTQNTGFSELSWRAPPRIGGRLLVVELVVRDEAPGGQFEYYFCSINCIRDYIISKLDTLEEMASAYLGES